MGLLEGLLEWTEGLVGIIGVLALLAVIGVGIFFAGTLVVLFVGVPFEEFTHDKNLNLRPARVVIMIGLAIGLFLVRWYLPLAAAALAVIIFWIKELGTLPS
jgi:hypothetical protein